MSLLHLVRLCRGRGRLGAGEGGERLGWELRERLQLGLSLLSKLSPR